MAKAPVSKKGAASKESSKKKAVMQMADKIQALAESLRKELNKRMDGGGRAAKMHSAEFAMKLVKFQRSTFDKAFKIVTRVQERADKMIMDHIDDAEWMPDEGKAIAKEWSRTIGDGRAEFQKAVDKSYDLLNDYFGRLKKAQKAIGKKPVAAKPAMAMKKKAPVKKAMPVKAKSAQAASTASA